MQCLKCGKEAGHAEKCSYCGGPVAKAHDSRFSTTIIESQDILNKMLNSDQPMAPSHQAQAPHAGSSPGPGNQPIPQQQNPNQPPQPPPAPRPLQASPQQGQPHPPIAQPAAPVRPAQPISPVPSHPQKTPQPAQGLPQRPPVLPNQIKGQPLPQGIPARPQAIQPEKITQHPAPAQPYPTRPVQQAPRISPQSPVPSIAVPKQPGPIAAQPVRPPIAQGQPQKISPIPLKPIPVGTGQMKSVPQPIQQPRPISPMQPQKSAVPIPPRIQPVLQTAGPQPPVQRPVSAAMTPQSPVADGITEPINFQAPQRPPVPFPPQAHQYGGANSPQPQINVAPPRPPVHLPADGNSASAGFIPPTPAPPAAVHSYESGIDIKPVETEMEVISSDEFFSGQDSNQYDYSSLGGAQDENLPPAFARAKEDQDNIPSLPRTITDSRPQTGGDRGWSAEEFPLDREPQKKGPYINKRESHAGNEVTYKIITIAMTILAFFSLRIIDTLRIGINNPYDKIFFIRLLIFAIIFLFTGYLFFIKNLGNKESLIKTIVVILFVVGFIGSFIGMSGISTSAESNFFAADAENYFRLLENNKGIAKCPSFSPDGSMAVVNYAPNNMLENTIHILKINLANEDKPADKVELPATCNKQMYWLSATEILYPGRKISPSEPFKFEVIEANTGITNTIFMSFEYNFVMDYDYSRETKRIAASFANLIWLLDLETGAIMPVTGLDMLARQFDTPPNPADMEINPSIFVSSLVANRGAITDVPFLDTSPRFSSDGRSIYFVRTNPSNMQDSKICRVNLDSLDGTVKPTGLKSSADLLDFLMNTTEILTVDSTFYGKITVSPSSRFIACWVRAKQGDSPNITFNENSLVIFDTKEKALIRIFPTYPTEASIDQLDWSPDGKYLVADMNSGINSIIIMIEIPSAIVKMDEESKPAEDL